MALWKPFSGFRVITRFRPLPLWGIPQVSQVIFHLNRFVKDHPLRPCWQLNEWHVLKLRAPPPEPADRTFQGVRIDCHRPTHLNQVQLRVSPHCAQISETISIFFVKGRGSNAPQRSCSKSASQSLTLCQQWMPKACLRCCHFVMVIMGDPPEVP